MKLSLYYPVTPLKVNQAFGIFNPAYEQFGFNKHNGIDYATTPEQLSYAMCDSKVVEVKSYPNGAGNAVRIRTLEKMNVGDEFEFVEFMYMHAEKVLVKEGQIVKRGQELTITDSTGFSTGNHLHISAYFVDPNQPIGSHKLPIGDKASDYCFDFSLHYSTEPQVDPLIETQIVKGLDTARLALKYPWLIVPAKLLLTLLSKLLK